MEFDNNDILHQLERPPSKDNLSIYNIVQLVLMLILGITSAYRLYYLLFRHKLSLANLVDIIIDALIIIGLTISIFGLIGDNTGHLKGGFIIFYLGCIILLIKKIIDLFRVGFNWFYLIDLILAILLIFVITKQIQHL